MAEDIGLDSAVASATVAKAHLSNEITAGLALAIRQSADWWYGNVALWTTQSTPVTRCR